MNSHNIVM